ncbi:MAG TPA: hypothetical protein PLX89_18415 [Verrucomicrobiota bacterium]|nr:hypothetical protein [Verrucomicrobiota bacterium]
MSLVSWYHLEGKNAVQQRFLPLLLRGVRELFRDIAAEGTSGRGHPAESRYAPDADMGC